MNYKELLARNANGDFIDFIDYQVNLDPRTIKSIQEKLNECKSVIIPPGTRIEERIIRDESCAALEWILENPTIDRFDFAFLDWHPEIGIRWEDHVQDFQE